MIEVCLNFCFYSTVYLCFQVLQELREQNVRIIIADFFSNVARAVMCEAFRQVRPLMMQNYCIDMLSLPFFAIKELLSHLNEVHITLSKQKAQNVVIPSIPPTTVSFVALR